MAKRSRTPAPSPQRWTRDQLLLTFDLYCRTPFGKLHSRNPTIIALASLIGRTPSAVAMKAVNFASLDPSITGSGRKGLANASEPDRKIWGEFNADWEKLTIECEAVRARLVGGVAQVRESVRERDFDLDDYTGEVRLAIVAQRKRQDFFREAVLSSYRNRCCVSGVAEIGLLAASHIVPWRVDKNNRLNPRNGLCLSAIHDRAFDRGLITVSADYRVVLSSRLSRARNSLIKEAFQNVDGKAIEMPERFAPDKDFLAYHRREVFIGKN